MSVRFMSLCIDRTAEAYGMHTAGDRVHMYMQRRGNGACWKDRQEGLKMCAVLIAGVIACFTVKYH